VELLGHLADEITQRGYGMFLQKILPPMENWLTRLINSRRADGIVVIGQSTEHAALEEAAQHYKPMVVWGGHLDKQSYCSVGTDNVGGARVAVDHLIRMGRRRIVFLGPSSIPEIKLRFEGYSYALSRAPRGAYRPKSVFRSSDARCRVRSHARLDSCRRGIRRRIRSHGRHCH
jgi:DNA-binding LacI/PurR family transcriptional regulator